MKRANYRELPFPYLDCLHILGRYKITWQVAIPRGALVQMCLSIIDIYAISGLGTILICRDVKGGRHDIRVDQLRAVEVLTERPHVHSRLN